MKASVDLKKKGMRFTTLFAVLAGLALRHLPCKRTHIVVACMPKSGSTYLVNLLSSYGNLRAGQLVPAYDDREQELCEIRLLAEHRRNYVAQLHIRNSSWTQEMLRRYQVTCIVLIRNLADCVASIRDHIRKEKHFGSLLPVDARVLSLTDEQLDALIIHMVMPWYITFFDGWVKSNALLLSYDEVTQEPERAMAAALSRAGMPVDALKISAAIEQGRGKYNRLNKGVSGRGADLSDANKDSLRKLIALYPDVYAHAVLGRV